MSEQVSVPASELDWGVLRTPDPGSCGVISPRDEGLRRRSRSPHPRTAHCAPATQRVREREKEIKKSEARHTRQRRKGTSRERENMTWHDSLLTIVI